MWETFLLYRTQTYTIVTPFILFKKHLHKGSWSQIPRDHPQWETDLIPYISYTLQSVNIILSQLNPLFSCVGNSLHNLSVYTWKRHQPRRTRLEIHWGHIHAQTLAIPKQYSTKVAMFNRVRTLNKDIAVPFIKQHIL